MIAWLLVACTPGSLDTPSGHEPLRTALMAPTDTGGTVLLSNGDFTCDLPDPDDQLAIVDALFSTCREGARHIVLQLDGADDSWSPVSAIYVEILEASVRDEDGLIRELQVDAMDVHELMERIELDVRASDGDLVGRVDLTTLDVTARFRAERCAPDSELFTALAAAGGLGCP